MASVFLSYDREDVARARPIASALEKAGHSVWWDSHIKGGAEFGKAIEQALAEAEAVVVLWSRQSVDSPWVRDEAAAGRDRGRLVPVRLDSTEPPLGFRQYQSIDISGWKGRGNPPRLADILKAIDGLSGEEGPPQATNAHADSRPAPDRPGKGRLAYVAIAILAALGLAYWLIGRDAKNGAPVVAVTASDENEASRSLAEDMFIKLGSLQSADSTALRLVEPGSAAEADLVFKLAQRPVDGQAQATIALVAQEDGRLLWSSEYWQKDRSLADLRQQVAYALALVLKCTSEAMGQDHKPLSEPTLNLYLVGCARLPEKEAEPRPLVTIFDKVTQGAPDFEGGWAKLLTAETHVVKNGGDAADAQRLRTHIAMARRRNPTMAEAYVAESWLYPTGHIKDWMALMVKAVSENPTNVWALTEHSNDMYQVGRLQDGVEYARRAVQADPLSPDVRVALITALANAGEIEAARQAMEEAERLWPGASNLREVRFSLMYLFGDPKEALAMLRSGQVSRQTLSPAVEPYLEARIAPNPERIERAVRDARAVSGRWFNHYIETLAEFGRKDELLRALMAFDPGTQIGPAQVFRAKYRLVQNDPRFMAVMKRWKSQIGYWQASGQWPDFCFRSGLPYDCREEAAKLK